MKTRLFSIITILVLVCHVFIANSATAGEYCAGCDAAGDAQKRGVVGRGSPDDTAVCFYALMTDRSDSISVTITYKGSRGEGKPITFPKGAAQAMSGDKKHPMVCIPREKLAGAIKLVAIPGSKEGCAILDEAQIAWLLREKQIPLDKPACLLKAPALCDALKRQKGW